MGKQKYRVTAGTKVLGTAPGEEFERELDEKQEARLINSGAIEKVEAEKKPAGTAKGKE